MEGAAAAEKQAKAVVVAEMEGKDGRRRGEEKPLIQSPQTFRNGSH